jgi:hypothetical protein
MRRAGIVKCCTSDCTHCHCSFRQLPEKPTTSFGRW